MNDVRKCPKCGGNMIEGFLHSEQFGKPSLVCDFQELYRYLIDYFVIQYCQNLARRYFTFKIEKMTAQKKGKREYLNDAETRDFTAKLNAFFEDYVELPRIKVGERQTIETLINEEALLFAKYLRGRKERMDTENRNSNLMIKLHGEYL